MKNKALLAAGTAVACAAGAAGAWCAHFAHKVKKEGIKVTGKTIAIEQSGIPGLVRAHIVVGYKKGDARVQSQLLRTGNIENATYLLPGVLNTWYLLKTDRYQYGLGGWVAIRPNQFLCVSDKWAPYLENYIPKEQERTPLATGRIIP